MEIWQDIPGYESIYQASTIGNIKSLARKDRHGYFRKEKILKPTNQTSRKYLRVTLRKNNIRKHWSVHRLVLMTFIPNINNKPEVNHKDGNIQNNCIENLEWCTRQENLIHAVKTNLRVYKYGNAHFGHKLNEAQVLKLRKYSKYIKLSRLVKHYKKLYKVHKTTILKAISGANWTYLK